MKKDQNNVVHLHQRDLSSALERLNRITGLQFSSWPESLLPTVPQDIAEPAAAEPADEALVRQLG
ncbi:MULTISPECIES: hypothetical protein [Pseudomonas]|uniref:Uncharacterized protein n=1 Tax=Pseudomonas nitroreducens TaxID=46680 RepID=A0A246FB39_PSENT|nr:MULTISPECIES: hypothetical protein [Pseudomonas]MCG8906211.1 hypothetical protein [Pseudomonas sp. DP-17]MDU4250659.1 hypothetical protein [Pseudomonas sp.]OWP51542.1 hypothetical protein CEG18_04530 [Pseudomonas nitroreducens]